ncbi:sugar-transfer associated ATP-grasp domain-containing protein [Leucobacter tenebrionis]|uniref:sugar-transfer associated ATP-grasp domain-containing protein n=1 Tax=Leucobacter tenebrionis TaxID=2873270 RepID=UPI001CA793A7|nr:sugar-transfer associated ATP-grasp domain-containing protein [Leucobacter tenebrionis]QZY53117.1 hypothetical protein KVY00_06760 [Leucobacter tenebrionis]
MPATVENFGIDEDNREGFVSERDYAFIHPLNGKYGKWVRDRVSALTVFEPFTRFFETAHFHLLIRDGELHCIPLSPEAQAHGNDPFAGVISLLQEKGRLSLVRAAWAREAPEALTWDGDDFFVDGEQVSADELREWLLTRTRSHISVLIDPVDPDLGFPESLGARTAVVRVTMANPDGSHPRAVEASLILDEQEPRPGCPTLHARLDPQDGSFKEARAVESGRLRRYTHHPETNAPLSGYLPSWSTLESALVEMCQFAPQLKFVQFDAVLSSTGDWVLVKLSASPDYPRYFAFSEETVKLLKQSIDFKRQSTRQYSVRTRKWFHNLKLWLRKRFARLLYPKGLVPYQSVRWLGDVRRDLFERNGVPLRTKLWAYRNGFLSYRIPQYGITAQNRESFISDFEYRWLRHINQHYRYWLEDKISIKYVAAAFNDCLPAYYFYTTLQGGVNHVVPMMDCPSGYAASFEGILALARVKGVLALKPDEGSHGDGFYRLGYENGEFSLNGQTVSEADVLAILTDRHNQYLVTEFIEMHPELARIYPHSVNTIRVIVFKRDGVTPEIGNAYLRIGSAQSGFVDNTAAGGMLAEIDAETGAYGNAQILQNGHVQPCPHHPDTGVLIEGHLPNWGYAKKKVLEIAAAMPQLEYLGFDLAVTPTGIKLPEINRSPDYPRIERLTPATIDYLLYKLEQKKRRYGYDQRPPRRLISLPRRG